MRNLKSYSRRPASRRCFEPESSAPYHLLGVLRYPDVIMSHYDAIVVGAGPAGCAAAYDLAAAGRSVLLLDRCHFPRSKPCAGALTVKTVKALRYSIAPVIREVCTRSAILKDSTTCRIFQGRHPFCIMTMRSEFDDFCLRQTIAAGAHFRRIQTWTDISESRDQVTIQTNEGPLTAKFLVGADGANSRVRQFVPAGSFYDGLALEVNVPRNGHALEMQFDFGVVDGGYGWIFPKRDHYNMGLYTSRADVRITRSDVLAYAARRLQTKPTCKVVGHKIGFGGWNCEPCSRRIFLVGDAAGLVDSLLGEGIYNAIVSGQAAAYAIHVELTRGIPAPETFRARLKPIQHDAQLCFRAARRFYADMERGYAALTSPIIRYSLIKGYSMGLTFASIKNWFFTLPLRRTPRLEHLFIRCSSGY